MNVLKPPLWVPTHYVRQVSDITEQDFFSAFPGAGLVTMDLDGTLLDHHDPASQIPEKNREFLDMLRGHGVIVGIISNAPQGKRLARAQSIGEALGSIVDPRLILASGNFIGNKRKPYPRMFLYASTVAGIPPERCVHLGDQSAKDIVGARLAGFGGSVLVAMYGEEGDWRVGVQRYAEAAGRSLAGMAIRMKDYPTHLTQVSSNSLDLAA